jgi:hypothetical protein
MISSMAQWVGSLAAVVGTCLGSMCTTFAEDPPHLRSARTVIAQSASDPEMRRVLAKRSFYHDLWRLERHVLSLKPEDFWVSFRSVRAQLDDLYPRENVI